MEMLAHVLVELAAALGRVLLWISTALVVEELTWGGLARLLLSQPHRFRRGRGKRLERG